MTGRRRRGRLPALLLLVLPRAARGALNLGQAIEEAVVQLRERIYVVDGLVAALPADTCDSSLDGPHCRHVGVVSAFAGADSALLADGILSARLFGSSSSGEVLDEAALRIGAPAATEGEELEVEDVPVGAKASRATEAAAMEEGEEDSLWIAAQAAGLGEEEEEGPRAQEEAPGQASPAEEQEPPAEEQERAVEEPRPQEQPAEATAAAEARPLSAGATRKSPRARGAGNRRGAGPSRGRSALLSFRGMEPWCDRMPLDFAGTRMRGGGFPFSLRWRGPWVLTASTIPDNAVVKAGRFVAELRGAIGAIHFGRPVHLQAIDLARPMRPTCLEEPAVPDPYLLGPPLPLVIKGRRAQKEVFTEVVPAWELSTFVNGVAFTGLTSTQPVDEVVFLAAECLLVGAVQATFGEVAAPAGSQGAPQALLLALHDGWRAYGWEDAEFRHAEGVGDAPAWSLNEVVRHRLTFRQGVFEEPPQLFEDAAGGEQPPGVGPEKLRMPPGMEEVEEVGLDILEPLETVMSQQRNASVLSSLARALHDSAASALLAARELVSATDAPLLHGLTRQGVNMELTVLLKALVEAAKSGGGAAQDADEVFDGIWRRLGLDVLDCLLIRWRAAEIARQALEEEEEEPQDLDAGAAEAAAAAGEAAQHPEELLGTEAAASLDGLEGLESGGEDATVASLIPGGSLTHALVNYILRAAELLAAKAKTKRKQLLKSLAVRLAAQGALGGRAGEYVVRLEPDAAAGGLRVRVGDGRGHELASNVEMGEVEVASVLQAFGLGAAGGDAGATALDASAAGAADTGAEAGEDQGDEQGGSEEENAEEVMEV